MEMMLTVITQQLARSDLASGSNSFKLKDPDNFSGGQKDLGRFLAALHLKFQVEAKKFMTDEAKVGYAASLLRGAAESWFQPKLTRRVTDALGQEVPDTPKLGTFAQFEFDIRTAFGDPDAKATADRAIMALRQQGNITKYTAEFRRLMADLTYNDAAYIPIYRRGLAEEIKDELARRDDPDSLEDLISMATKIDSRLYARKMEKQGKGTARHSGQQSSSADAIPRTPVSVEPPPSSFTAGGLVPMDLSATTSGKRGPLTDAERKERLEKNLCLYCGKAGHIASAHHGKGKSTEDSSSKN